MKALKIVAIIVGGIVVLLAVLVAVAFMPSVQTWAVRKAVAGQPGMEIAVGKVAAGMSSADITDLRYVKDGMVVTAKNVSAHYNAWDYISKKRINADSVVIDDLVIDMTKAPAAAASATSPAGSAKSAPGASGSGATTPATTRVPPAGAAGKKEPFEGLLKQAQLPFDVRIANLAAKGKAMLPQNQMVTFDVKGTGIETGQRGKVDWTVDFADSTAGAALRALRATGSAQVHIAADKRIDVVEVETTAAAMGPKISAEPIKIVAKADKPSANGDENYSATVSLARTPEPLIKTTAQFVAASREITGGWDIAIRTEQLGGLLAGLGLPELAAKGAGKFSFKPDTNAVAASGNLEAQTAQLQKFMPELAAVGVVQLKTAFDGGMADNIARLDKLDLEVAGGDGKKFAQINSLQKITYTLTDKRVTLANPKGELARISLQSLPLAWAQAFAKGIQIDSGDLSMVLTVEAEPDGSRIRTRAVEPLTLRNVTIRQGQKKYADRVTLTTRPSIDYSAAKIVAQLADLNVSMPAGDAVNGNISAEITNLSNTPSIAFSTQLQAKSVTAHKPFVPVETGPLAITANVEGRYEGVTLHLTKVTKTINREGGALLAAVEFQQPVKADLKAFTFAVANPNATAARLRLGEFPLAWAEAFVAKSKFAGSFGGGTLDVAVRSLDDVTLTTAEPITLRGASVTLDGKPQLQNVDLMANLSATKHGDAIAYELRKLEVKQGQTLLATANVTGDVKLGAKMTIAAKGNLEADAAALMAQPALAPFATLSRGRIAAAFDASVADTTQAKAAISAKGLVAKQENRALGDLEVNLTANVKPDGSGTVVAPLTLTNGNRKSDVSIDGAFGKSSNGQNFLFTGKIASNQLVVDDFQPLAALAPASPEAKPAARPTPAPRGGTPPASTPPPRDAAPFWKGVNGKVDVDLKRVLYGKDYAITGIRGAAVITDNKLSLDGLEGRFKENPFKLAAAVTYAAQQQKPYSITGSANVTNLAIGELLRAGNPNEKPAIESNVTVVSNFNGTGLNIADLGKNVYGKFELSGAKGVLRALGKKSDMVSAGSTILGLAGALTGSNSTTAVAEVAAAFTELQFDNFKIQLERSADLSIKLTTIEFISAIMRTAGNGKLGNQPNVAMENQPMEIMLQFGAKGRLAELLAKANALGNQTDDKGYQLLQRSFTVGGTPSKPDSGALWRLLLSEATTRGLPALEGLLNKRAR